MTSSSTCKTCAVLRCDPPTSLPAGEGEGARLVATSREMIASPSGEDKALCSTSLVPFQEIQPGKRRIPRLELSNVLVRATVLGKWRAHFLLQDRACSSFCHAITLLALMHEEQHSSAPSQYAMHTGRYIEGLHCISGVDDVLDYDVIYGVTAIVLLIAQLMLALLCVSSPCAARTPQSHLSALPCHSLDLVSPLYSRTLRAGAPAPASQSCTNALRYRSSTSGTPHSFGTVPQSCNEPLRYYGPNRDAATTVPCLGYCGTVSGATARCGTPVSAVSPSRTTGTRSQSSARHGSSGTAGMATATNCRATTQSSSSGAGRTATARSTQATASRSSRLIATETARNRQAGGPKSSGTTLPAVVRRCLLLGSALASPFLGVDAATKDAWPFVPLEKNYTDPTGPYYAYLGSHEGLYLDAVECVALTVGTSHHAYSEAQYYQQKCQMDYPTAADGGLLYETCTSRIMPGSFPSLITLSSGMTPPYTYVTGCGADPDCCGLYILSA